MKSTSGKPVSAVHTTPKGNATRDRIIEAAARLMAEHGVDGMSIADVQRAANVSSSQVYHYFADKDELRAAAVQRQVRIVLDAQAAELDRLDSVAGLRAWRERIIAEHRDNEHAVLMVDPASGDTPELKAILAAGFERWQRAIRTGLTAMQAGGELSPRADAERLAVMLAAAIQGGFLLARVHGSADPLATALDLAIDYIARLRTRRKRVANRQQATDVTMTGDDETATGS